MVEQETHKLLVGSSNLPLGTILRLERSGTVKGVTSERWVGGPLFSVWMVLFQATDGTPFLLW